MPENFFASSGVFDFYYDDDNETLYFELKIYPGPKGAIIEVVNRNDFKVGFKVNLSLTSLRPNSGSPAVCKFFDQTINDYLETGKVTPFTIPGDQLDMCLKWQPHANYVPDFYDLLIDCKIEVFQVVGELQNIPIPSRETALQSWQRLLSDNTFSDFVITCSDQTSISCHRAVLANKSTVFKRFFEGQWKDSKALKIIDFGPDIVKQMIYFMYTNELPEYAKPSEDLLRIGDKYDVNGLVAFCATAIARNFNTKNAIRCQCL